MRILLILCFAPFLTLCGSMRARDDPFQVLINADGNYNVAVNGVTWLPSAATWFNEDNKKFSTKDGTLQLINVVEFNGKDQFGEYITTIFTYQAGRLSVDTSIKVYKDPSLPLAVFSQRYSNAANSTRGKHADDTISSFPSFKIGPEEPTQLGYIAYGNDMAGWVSLEMGEWTAEKANFSTGIEGGPIVLFDKFSNAMVISPFSKFMAASNVKVGDNQESHVSWGIMGLVDEVYENYTIDFIVYFSDKGINDAMRGWGKHLTAYYGKTNVFREKDLTLSHLGYWTDNGAYYYYNPEKGKNYEDTLLDVVKYMQSLKIPIKSLQIDMFFYPKGHVKGTKTWIPEKEYFPNGFDYLYNKTGLPITCHNKYWDSDTTYASFNGGKYDFLRDNKTGYALPVEKQFWIEFLRSTKSWGKFIMYEQDFLNVQFDRTQALLTDLDLGREWLLQMGEGAEASDVTIQYCMAYSRHILQSLEIPRVTQARVSDDYHPGYIRWKIGFTSMFTDALNLASSKDNFWTTEYQPGNRYHLNESIPQVEVMVATLSTGPVGVGDGVGYTNASLLMKCCDSDGKILRASRPLTVMDKSAKQAAFGNSNPDGRREVLYSTVSVISQTIFGIIIANEIGESYNLEPADLTPEYTEDSSSQRTYIYSGIPDSSGKYTFVPWSRDSTLPVNERTCGKNKWCVFYSTPIFGRRNESSIGLLGEFGSKFSPVSPQRFSDLRYDTGSLKVKAALNAREVIDVWFLIVVDLKPTPIKVRCDNSQGLGQVKASVSADTTGKCECKI